MRKCKNHVVGLSPSFGWIYGFTSGICNWAFNDIKLTRRRRVVGAVTESRQVEARRRLRKAGYKSLSLINANTGNHCLFHYKIRGDGCEKGK